MRVVVHESRARRADATSLFVRVGIVDAEAARERLEAAVSVSIEDARLSRRMTRAIAEAVRAAGVSLLEPCARVVRLRTRKRLARLGGERLSGAIVIVRITEGNARRLVDLVEAIRAAGPLAVQLVWDGKDPDCTRVEHHVFATLERARGSPAGPPVVLSKSSEPVEALRVVVLDRQKRENPR